MFCGVSLDKANPTIIFKNVSYTIIFYRNGFYLFHKTALLWSKRIRSTIDILSTSTGTFC